jgi:hypothetical protein
MVDIGLTKIGHPRANVTTREHSPKPFQQSLTTGMFIGLISTMMITVVENTRSLWVSPKARRFVGTSELSLTVIQSQGHMTIQDTTYEQDSTVDDSKREFIELLIIKGADMDIW